MIIPTFHQLLSQKPVIGMVHLGALPGSHRYQGSIDAIGESALRDVHALQQGGVDAIMVENFFDAPFYQDQVGAETVAAMSRIISQIRAESSLPLGINVLRNDVCSAIAIATATNAQFVRVNVLSSAMLTDQGIIEGKAAQVLRYRASLQSDVAIMADCMVKHAYRLSDQVTLAAMAEETWERAGADALIISGSGTGKPTSVDDLSTTRQAVPEAPLFVGSGVTTDTLHQLLSVANGVIVGTAVKQGGDISQPVDPDLVRELVSRKDQ